MTELSYADFVPIIIARKIASNSDAVRQIARYRAMTDDELLSITELYYRNLTRIRGSWDDESNIDKDAYLQVVLVPELWERITANTRTHLRRIIETIAEYTYNPERPSVFERSRPGIGELLSRSAHRLREQIAHTEAMETRELLETIRFVIRGARPALEFSVDAPVYEPAFVYRLVPVIALRAAEHSAEKLRGVKE